MFDSWLLALPAASAGAEDKEELSALFAWLVPPCLRLAAKGCPQVGESGRCGGALGPRHERHMPMHPPPNVAPC